MSNFIRYHNMIGYKLMRQRKDGTLGPLFINRRLRVPIGEWLDAEDHPTKGYAHRPGWHILAAPNAPHLSKKGRVWVKVEFNDWNEFERPVNQGGRWYLAQQMKVVGVIYTCVECDRTFTYRPWTITGGASDKEGPFCSRTCAKNSTIDERWLQ